MAAGVDASRAYLPLSRIEPVPSRPVRPASLQPLSERAAQQIARADQLVEQQRFTEAAIELERALRYDPNHPDIHQILALLHWRAGNIERARSHAERALEENRDNAAAHYILGRCHLTAQDAVAATQAFRTALLCSDIEKNREIKSLCHYFLAEALRAAQYVMASLEQYAAFESTVAAVERPAHDPDLTDLLRDTQGSTVTQRASLFEQLGRFGDAADVLKPHVAAHTGDVELGLRYARLLLQARRHETALEFARGMPADDQSVLALLFEIHEASGHPERMVDDLRARRAQRPDDAAIVLQLADVWERLKQAASAAAELRSFLESKRDSTNVRARLVELLLADRQWAEALRVAADGLELDPRQASALESRFEKFVSQADAAPQIISIAGGSPSWAMLYLAGLVAVQAGHSEAAVPLLRGSLEKNADFAPARAALAQAYLDSFQYDDALATAGRRDPDAPESAELELIVGEVYDRLDQVDKADLHFRAAMQLDRSDPRPLLALAGLYENGGRRLQAQRQLRAVLERFPDHDLAREMLLESYLQDGQFDAAIEQVEELSRRATSPLVKARCDALLSFVIRKQDLDAYRAALQAAMKEHGEDVATWLALADSYGPDGDADAKADALRKALALDPTNEEAAVGLVDVSRRLLAFEESAERLKDLLCRRPNRLPWRLAFLDRLQILGRFDEALSFAQEQVASKELTDEDRRKLQHEIFQTLRAAGRDEDLLAILQAWSDEKPDDHHWSVMLANELLRLEKPESAIPIFEKIYLENKEWRALLALANARQDAGQHDRAMQYLLERLNDDPENDEALGALAQALTIAKRYDEALDLICNRLLHTLQRQGFQNEGIRILLIAGQFTEALDLIDTLLDEAALILRATHEAGGRLPVGVVTERPISRLPNEPFTLEDLNRRIVDLRIRRVDTLLRAKDPTQAELVLNEWLENARDPQERFYYLGYLGQCYRAKKQEQQATDVLSRALLLQPKNEVLNNDVAYGWIDQGIRLDEAEPMIRFALAEQPRNAAFLDTYAWLLYKRGDFAGAKEWLQRATLALRNADPVMEDHLGDTLWRLGEKEQAIRHWEEAIKIVADRAPDAPESADVERVRLTAPKKVEEARAGREPSVAPLAVDEKSNPSETNVPDGDPPPNP